ncbi:Putative proteasome inhibitor [Eufriesea mexicana]|uniref:Proteasome inhibitor PI31 subunit n=1 Tax=Eufriesea mexicana TaxID=516756 RepID=A0A310SCG5_9HYME|nr:Putative proteasome inhibitor [Eufriesea mexicana]
MDNANRVFGFELLQEIYNTQITKKEDILILFVHWYLIKQGFRCIGIGDSKIFEPSDKGSQLLPEGWNTHPNYVLRYINNSRLFIFHAIKSDEDYLLINLLKVDGENVSNVQVPINQNVTDLYGPLETLLPSYQNVINIVQKDLIDPLLPGNTTENFTQTPTNDSPRDETARPGEVRIGQWLLGPSRTPCADLNPFGRGGGMIYDPFSSLRNLVDPRRPGIGAPGRLPPGAVPPFARFNPFAPPDHGIDHPRPRHDPDNDHLPPPGYDDMFM